MEDLKENNLILDVHETPPLCKWIVLSVQHVFALTVTAALLFAGCGSDKANNSGGQLAYEDYINTGKRIAVQTGDVYGHVAREIFGASEVPEYTSMPNVLEELRRGRVDAAITNASYIKQMEDAGAMANFRYFLIPKEDYKVESGLIFHTAGLRDKFNEWLKIVTDDGTLGQMINRWIGVTLPKEEDVPQFQLTATNGTLRLCDTGNYPPFTYFDSKNRPTGFNVEFTSRFAQHLGMDTKFTMMDYDGLALHVASGKSDMSGSLLTITDERKDGMVFSDPVIVTQAVLIVRR
jgi:ABC-type amino acid transport substrate-binding protein